MAGQLPAATGWHVIINHYCGGVVAVELRSELQLEMAVRHPSPAPFGTFFSVYTNGNSTMSCRPCRGDRASNTSESKVVARPENLSHRGLWSTLVIENGVQLGRLAKSTRRTLCIQSSQVPKHNMPITVVSSPT
jgi:hypothetical protein